MESQSVEQVEASGTGTLAELLLTDGDKYNNVSAWTENLRIVVYKDGRVKVELKGPERTVASIQTELADLMACMTALKGKSDVEKAMDAEFNRVRKE